MAMAKVRVWPVSMLNLLSFTEFEWLTFPGHHLADVPCSGDIDKQ